MLAFGGVLAVVTVLRAQEAPPAAAPPATSAAPAPSEAPAEAAPAGDAAADEQPATTNANKVPARPAPASGPSPARFEPTEKVRADFDVSFPIDI